MNRATLGVAIITKNAERRLDAVLAALTFADRVVVLDSGSTDSTLAIARAHGATVHTSTDWPGFGIQKNRALDLLETDWELLIDADEVVSPELARSISNAVMTGGSDVYVMNRLSSFCGHWMHHSDWFPDWVPRLIRRGRARYAPDLVHEKLLYEGAPGRLDGLLHHYSYESYEDVLRKLDQYSTLGAEQRHARGERGGLAKAVARGFWAFVRTYVIKQGFRDGSAGLQVAIFNAQTVYYRFLKLGLKR
ncbi:glycosyltransferase family 2 protein [Chitinibacteraceae bacterium HSL-7]